MWTWDIWHKCPLSLCTLSLTQYFKSVFFAGCPISGSQKGMKVDQGMMKQREK